YAALTSDVGPLSLPTVPAAYRILPTDNEAQRKVKGYSWIIDNQLAVIMPNAKPTPDSTQNYAYYEKYLDYIMLRLPIGLPPPPDPGPSPTPPPSPSPSPSPAPSPAPPSPPPPPPPPPSPKPPPIGVWPSNPGMRLVALGGLLENPSGVGGNRRVP